jgi:hypothetical protein
METKEDKKDVTTEIITVEKTNPKIYTHQKKV